MPGHLQRSFALWFVLQIALPFTSPLQSCDLWDLIGTRQHGIPVSRELPTPPLPSAANSFVSPLAVSTLRASASLARVDHVGSGERLTSTFALSPAPQVERTVLRL